MSLCVKDERMMPERFAGRMIGQEVMKFYEHQRDRLDSPILAARLAGILEERLLDDVSRYLAEEMVAAMGGG